MSSREPGRPSAARWIVLLLMATTLCGTATAEPGAKTPPEFRIAGSPWVGDAPTRIAAELGYFNPPEHDTRTREVIRVEQYDTGKQAFEALLGEEVEFALAAPEPVAIGLLRRTVTSRDPGDDVVILASVTLSNLSHHVVTDRRRGIERPVQLAGRRIGLVLDTSAHHAWDRFAEFHGMASDSVTLVDMPIGELAEGLARGHIDAAVTWDPWVEPITETLGDQAVVFSMRELHAVDWLLVTRREIALARPDITDRVLRGYLRAIDHIYRNPDALHTPPPSNIIWHINLGWSVLSNLDTQFEWLRRRPEFARSYLPKPGQYLEAGPLSRVAPHRVKLPAYIHSPARPAEPGP
ncbi:hypothetical protein B1C78_10415 [Thioalkalivibrio denitrificans]|uniref:SsuA/THI5-like domain-containing protein n=1 Tax=Thioalkalivibrio denitrificans TaxID=108003 RepID=A0A1V3NF54_9GAMM|nr:ABC transporter substrate-binding protein [Thioalkalivibrio denitrificans]OOG23691.1 hypothetical protein B1C78_10415 [Thioalkalivibrio denitrificans]